MDTYFQFPPNLPVVYRLPTELAKAGLADVIEATVTAGMWAESEIMSALKQGFRAAAKGDGADLTSFVDLTSEKIMVTVLGKHGYQGASFGEELTEAGIIINPAHEMVACFDGLDGTERAWKFTGGARSIYGPCVGIFLDRDGIIMPLRGATYLPRINQGFAASTETGEAYQFSLKRQGDVGVITTLEKLKPFHQGRTDAIYSVGAWENVAGEGFEPWVGHLFSGANAEKQQNILAASAGPDGIGNVLAHPIEGTRLEGIGPSVYVMCSDIRLHDVAWGLPAMAVLGGVVGNAVTGYRIQRDAAFIPERGIIGTVPYEGGLRGVKEKGLVAKIRIGPLVAAQNEIIFNKTRALMGYSNR